MCLILRRRSKEPYLNRTFIRYKVVSKEIGRDGAGRFLGSPTYYGRYQNFIYKNKDWNTARGNKKALREFGFHVFVDEHSCRSIAKSNSVIKKVQVRGFLRSGSFFASGSDRCETWRQFKFID